MLFTRIFFSLRLYFFFGIGFLTFSFFGGGTFVVYAQQELPQEALVDLVKPSIVRVAEHVSGTAKVPQVKVDIRKRLVAVIPDTYREVPVDEYLVGSGFIVHPDGYIATNSHVVSEETVKEMLASDNALAALYADALFLSEIEMQSFLETETENSFSQVVLKYVKQHSIFDLKDEVAVLRPDSVKKSIPELLKEGFPATMVSVNDNFLEDEKDVALIKINESRLPALALGVGETMTVGKKSFIFGFPATAELNQNNSLEATFTQGVVSAIKLSTDKNFKLYQTDAKVSEGSSGGPLFDETGAVVGIVTFQTDELNRTQGDNFAFALPIDMVRRAAVEADISPVEGKYSENFKKGFQYFSLKQCDKAGEMFRAAQSESNAVFVGDDDFAPYFKKCSELQKTGMALDTRLDRLKGDVRALGNPFFYLVGIGLLLFGIFGGALFWILHQVRREEREIAVLATRLRVDEKRLGVYEGVSEKKRKNIL